MARPVGWDAIGAEIETIRAAIGWHNIILTENSFMKKHACTALDLGGIAGSAEGFVGAMDDALRAYLHFAGASHLAWAPHLDREKRPFVDRL